MEDTRSGKNVLENIEYNNTQQENGFNRLIGLTKEQYQEYLEIKNNNIPKQKIKEKINELKKQDKEWTEELSEPDNDFKNIDRNLKRIKNQIDVLQELLEEGENNDK